MIVRCQWFCVHNDQCTLPAGHEPDLHQYAGGNAGIGLCSGEEEYRRPDWDQYFMASARLAATRGTCDRKRVGAVLVADKRVIATGYNGAPSGMNDCSQAGHQMVEFNDGTSSCIRTIHAEQNAIIQCAIVGISTVGAILYSTASPCLGCLKMIIQAGVSSVVFADHYTGARAHDADMEAVAKANGIGWRQLQ